MIKMANGAESRASGREAGVLGGVGTSIMVLLARHQRRPTSCLACDDRVFRFRPDCAGFALHVCDGAGIEKASVVAAERSRRGVSPVSEEELRFGATVTAIGAKCGHMRL
jgi:hypothetical protein